MSEREGMRRPSGRTWFDIAVLLVLVVLGVVGFEPSFGGYGFVLAGAGGLLVGAATGILASVFRLGAVLTTLGAVAAYFLLATPFTVPQLGVFGVLPTLDALAAVAVGSVYGWADIVTLATPIGAPQYIAVVPYVATWLVALVSTTLACRWLTREPRAVWKFAVALAGPVALYLAGVLMGTDQPYQAGIRGVVFGALALIWLGWRRPAGQIAQAGAARLRTRKLLGTAVVLVAAVVVGGGAAFAIAPPNDQRFVLREEIEPPFDPLDYPSPMAGFRNYSKQLTDEVLFSASGLKPGDRVRLATLDAYTGKLWNVTDTQTDAEGSGSFQLVGRNLPAPTLITPDARNDVRFTIQGYQDVWIPGVGYPTDLRFTAGPSAGAGDDLRYNVATGSAVITSGLREGDSYVMDAQVQQTVAPADLEGVDTATVQLSGVEDVPDIVTVRAQEYVGDTQGAIQQLEALRLGLVDNGYFSRGRASDPVPSRAGHGADRITDLFERTQMVGDEEQYATAFALMARTLGYPARVVLGFAPDIQEGQSSVDVTGDDVTAWVEVPFVGVGWVPFDPTPEETDIPQDQVPQPQSKPQPQVRQPPRLDDKKEDLLSPVQLEENQEDDNGLPFNLPGWVVALGLSILIPAALFFVPLLIIGGIKARRARRRRTRGPGHDRVAGAWEELTDRYSELGYAVPSRLTRVMVASRLEQQLGAEAPRLRPLAASTDEAVFSGADIDEARSEQVWTEALAAVEVARAGLSTWRQLVARFRMRKARDWVSRVADAAAPEPRRAPDPIQPRPESDR